MKHAVKFALVPGVALLILGLHWLGPGSGTPLVSDLRNTLHAPGFAVLTAIALLAFRRPDDDAALLKVAALVGVFALLAEASQVFTLRDADAGDALADLVGIAGALGLWLLCVKGAAARHARLARPVLALLTAVALTISVGAPVAAAYSIYTQNRLLPVLLDFEHGSMSRLYRSSRDNVAVVAAPRGWPKASGHVARVLMDNPVTDGGLEFAPYPDWSGYESLTFVAAAPSPVRLTLRIHDVAHNGEYADRFNTSFQLDEVPRVFRVPIARVRQTPSGRLLDVENIRTVMFFVADPAPDTTVLIDEIRLDPGPRN